jgi:PAS domain S-box-containing protein
LALPHTNATAVWAPSGLALAALLLGGLGLWPGVAVGAFLANLQLLVTRGEGSVTAAVIASAVIAAGNALEAVLGRWLFRRHIGAEQTDVLQRSRDPLVLAVVAAVSAAVAAGIGVTALTATGFTPWPLGGEALLTWWLGDLAGILIITPLILAVASFSALPRGPRLWIQGAFLAAVAVSAFALFGGGVAPDVAASVAYLVLPLVLVAAIWGGPLLMQLTVTVIAAAAVYGAVHVQGPFVRPSIYTRYTSLLLAQTFTCVLALAGSTLAAAIAERKLREQALGRTYRALQVLTRCNAAVVHAKEEKQLLSEVCRVAVETAGYHLAAVGYAEHDEAKTVKPVAYAGPAEVFLPRIRISWGDDEYGRGALGSAIRTGRPAVAHDLPQSPQYQTWRALVSESGFRSGAAVPLEAHGTLYGAIVFYTGEPNAFGASEIELLAELGRNLAHGILTLRMQKQREQAQEEAARRNRELAALASIFRQTTTKIDTSSLLGESLRGAMELAELEGGALCLLNSDGGLEQRASADASLPAPTAGSGARHVHVGDCLCERAASTGEPSIMWDNASERAPATPMHESLRVAGIRFHAAFPLKSHQRVLGVLSLYSRTDRKPDQRQLELVRDTCGPLALAIDNAMLYEQVQRHAAELEQRVQRRTAQLQQEMAQRELAERSLRDSEHKYRELVESANSIILRMDTEGCITFLNEFGQRFFGYGAEELLGHSVIGTIVPQTETSGRDLDQLIQDTATHPDRHSSNENENIRRDGTRAWISWTNRPIRDGDGRLVGCLSVGNDITPLKLAEVELEKAKEAAESADRIKSAFLATMSHELRTPLNSIIGFTGILLQQLPGPLNDEQRTQMGMVQGAARHLLALINDVLDISKIEAGQLTMQRAPFDLRAAIEKVIETVAPMARSKQLQLLWQIAADVGPFVGDQRRIEQILLNLLSNAIKFTERGQVALYCTREGGWVVISVQDSGCGIAESDRDTLFRPFRQLDTGLTRKHEGTGLGLAICKRLVDAMGGRIELGSEAGKGSTFTVRLPEEEPPSRRPQE